MQKTVNGLQPFEYQKISKEEQEKRGILGRLIGIIADPNKPTRNSRLYSRQLWEQVLDDPIFNEKLQNRVIFSEFEHPTDGRTSIEPRNITACLAEKPKFGKDGFLYGVFDILNTECGRLLKTLLDYGSTFAISSRGDGDLFTNSRGQEEVDPDSYQCFCFDIVSVPGVKEARLTPVLESYDGKKKTLTESLVELMNESDDKATLTEALEKLGISLNEDDTSNRAEELKKATAVAITKQEIKKPAIDHHALEVEAKEAVGDTYGNITNVKMLISALETAVNQQAVEDVQNLAKLIVKYDPDFTKEHPKVAELAERGMAIPEAPEAMPQVTPEAPANEFALDPNAVQGMPAEEPVEAPVEAPAEEVAPEQAAPAEQAMPAEPEVQTEAVNNTVYNNIMNESKDWTLDEINKVSDWMEEQGFLSFDEFKKAFDEGKFNSQQQEETEEDIDEYIDADIDDTPVEDIDEDEGKEEDGNAMLEMVNTLQEALKTKQEVEATVLELNEKLSVCYAKEAKQEDHITQLQEKLEQTKQITAELNKFKSRTEKQSALIESANDTIRTLNAKCQDVVTKYNTLVEKFNSNQQTVRSLNESLSSNSSTVEKLQRTNKSLREDLNAAQNQIKSNQEAYSTKLNESNQLIEKYKKVAAKAVNKYIDSQAVKLDITSNEIKNRLPENYTFNDIDQICENLQKQKISINLLPFKKPSALAESMNVAFTAKAPKEPILNQGPTVDDDIDESLKSLARM